MSSSSEWTCAYAGTSMRGTLRMGDLVYVNNTSINTIRAGDIIVYASTLSTRHKTIHRVRKVKPEGLMTQGDNCPNPDLCLVTAKMLCGSVTFIERHGIRLHISGGHRGLLRASLLRTLARIRAWLSPITKPSYKILGRTFASLCKWQPEIYKINITTSSGTVTKYIHNNKTVAYWKVSTNEWFCIKPYDLILNRPYPKMIQGKINR